MKNKKISVAILMGSQSDLEIMRKTASILEEFKINFDMTIASAHRSPAYVKSFIKASETNGAKVFIAAAGMAAHLAGVVASTTQLPVIGVPMGSKLNGLDSLLSTVQMPRGVPVATVAVDGAQNAGLLAIEILAIFDKAIAKKLKIHRALMTADVLKRAKKLKEQSRSLSN